MALQKVSTPQCITEKQQSALHCSPVSGTVSITWAAASPRHEFRVPSSPSPRLSRSATSSHYEFRVPSCSPRLSRSSSRSSSYSTWSRDFSLHKHLPSLFVIFALFIQTQFVPNRWFISEHFYVVEIFFLFNLLISTEKKFWFFRRQIINMTIYL